MLVEGAGGDGGVGGVGCVRAGGFPIVGTRGESTRAPPGLVMGEAVVVTAAAGSARPREGDTTANRGLTCGRVVVVDLLPVHVERRTRRAEATQAAPTLQERRIMGQ